MNTKKSSILYKYILSIFFVLTLSIFIGCNDDDDDTTPTNGNGPEPTPNQNEVIMQNNTYSPSSMTVAVGTTVTWVNRDPYAHTVTSGTSGNPTGTFDSGNIDANGSFSYTFNEAGTYDYYCQIHPGMNGTVTVE